MDTNKNIVTEFRDYAFERFSEKCTRVEITTCKVALIAGDIFRFEVMAYLEGKLCWGAALSFDGAVQECLQSRFDYNNTQYKVAV